MIYGTRITTICIAIFFSLSLTVSAGEVGELTEFKNGERADAEDVNANFTAVKKAVDNNHQKILILSDLRSVTYSAMGFSPKAAKTTESIDGYLTAFETEFNKDPADGSLAFIQGEDGTFYHSVTLPSGVMITRMHARVSGAAKVSLIKVGEADPLAEVTGSSGDPHNLEDSLEPAHTIEGFPASYFIEVTFSNRVQRLFSVAIEYAYPEP